MWFKSKMTCLVWDSGLDSALQTRLTLTGWGKQPAPRQGCESQIVPQPNLHKTWLQTPSCPPPGRTTTKTGNQSETVWARHDTEVWGQHKMTTRQDTPHGLLLCSCHNTINTQLSSGESRYNLNQVPYEQELSEFLLEDQQWSEHQPSARCWTSQHSCRDTQQQINNNTVVRNRKDHSHLSFKIKLHHIHNTGIKNNLKHIRLCFLVRVFPNLQFHLADRRFIHMRQHKG